MVQDNKLPRRGFIGSKSNAVRSIVVFGACFGLLWSLIAGISALRNARVFIDNQNTQLGTFYNICLGIYIGVWLIEFFGIFAALSRSPKYVRIFAYLSILATLLIVADHIIQIVVHFSFKNAILNVCTATNEGDHIVFTTLLGPVDGGTISETEAQQWCSRQFDRDSVSNIIALLLSTVISAIFVALVFAYLGELSKRDPSSAISMNPYSALRNPLLGADNDQAPAYLKDSNASVDGFLPPYDDLKSRRPSLSKS